MDPRGERFEIDVLVAQCGSMQGRISCRRASTWLALAGR
jgi:hypothetical protein